MFNTIVYLHEIWNILAYEAYIAHKDSTSGNLNYSVPENEMVKYTQQDSLDEAGGWGIVFFICIGLPYILF